MAHRTGQNRQQFGLFATPLEDMIAPDNMVRVVDAFVDAVDLEKLGFVRVRAHKRAAPPYHPALLLKIYLYGYLNRVRSSRRLELECGRNIDRLSNRVLDDAASKATACACSTTDPMHGKHDR